MKKNIIILICLIFPLRLPGQVFESFNNYTTNRFLFNPAATADYGIYVYTSLRYKWLGMDNAPLVQEAGFYNLLSTRQGLGAKITNMSNGLLRQTSISASYSFKTETTRSQYLFLGLWVRGVQRNLNIVDAYVFQNGDPTLVGDYYKKVFLTFGTGVTYKTRLLRFDVSMPSLLNDQAKLQKNLMAMAEYIFILKPNTVILMPSVLYMHNDPYGNTADINLNSLFWDRASVQVSYRTNQSIFVTVGYHSTFCILLSYEFSIGNITTFNHGTYEAMLTYAFGRIEKQKTRIRLPWNWTY
jgi:type IX secretion system PorP/SprF family membrane protein